MRFGSVCSGIESASVAWEPLGWHACWFAEVDRAASEVLKYRFPDVPNLGDMTLLPGKILRREIDAPDVLVGGTPCQSFSVAGMRRGLEDARGNLALVFIQLADAIDQVRREDGKEPCIVVFENVPGLLSSKDNAFGCFLAGLSGEDDALVPSGAKWTNAGIVLGPQRAICWRTLDAQYFGLAQRRRRVFVVASARAGFDPAAILLEFDGVRRDSAPSRDAGEGVAGTLDARTDGGGFPGTDGACSGHVVPAAVRRSAAHDSLGRVAAPEVAAIPTWWDGRDVSQTLDAVLHKGQTMPEKNRFPAVLQPISFGSKGAGRDAATDLSPTLRASGHAESHCNGGSPPAVAYAFQPRIARNGRGDMGDVVNALTAQAGDTGKGDAAPCVAVLPFDTTQITSPGNYSNPKAGDTRHPLAAGAHPPAVCVTGQVTHTLKAEGFDASEDGTGRGQPIVPAKLYSIMPMNSGKDYKAREVGVAQPPLAAGPVGGNQGGDFVMEPVQMAVRRLMPVECERLQGFPDNWTRVPTGKHGKLAADGPRYKQCGNSMAVKKMRWIGRRIADWLAANPAPLGHNSGAFEDLLG